MSRSPLTPLGLIVVCWFYLGLAASAFTPVSGVYYRIEARSTGKIVDCLSLNAGGGVRCNTFNRNGQESFTFVPYGDYFLIKNQLANLVLELNTSNSTIYLQAPAASSITPAIPALLPVSLRAHNSTRQTSGGALHTREAQATRSC